MDQAKKSLYDILKEKLGKKPATKKEIKQLKLEAEKEALKANIAKSKKIQKQSKTSIFGSKIFSDEKSSNLDMKKQLWGEDKD